jgi:two-component system response regulator NreC
MTTSIRVLLCDDHALIRSGLRGLLDIEDDLEVVGEAATTEDAIRQVRTVRPDVVLLDIGLPGRSGLDAIPDLQTASAQIRILILSMQDDASYVRRAFDAGANGYLLKDAADSELVEAIREVAAGRPYIQPVLAARVARTAAAPEPGTAVLSPREAGVLRLLALGQTNKEIAATLSISIRTVETDRARVLQKLHLATRAEIVRYALESGDPFLQPRTRTG